MYEEKGCLAGSLTEHSDKADELIKAVLTGNLLNVDARAPFRTLLEKKAFLVEWLARNTAHGCDIIAFAGVRTLEDSLACFTLHEAMFRSCVFQQC